MHKSDFQPTVSIIIPVYNGANYMREAIDSALAQTYDKTETIIINDGSNDNGETERIAQSYGGKVRYFSKPNGGVATALNLGISKMTGEYFSWLSHDDKYFPNKISAQIELLSQLTNKTTIIFSGWAIIDASGKEIHRVIPLRKYTEKQLTTPLFALLHTQINGCTLLIHKSHFARVGTFDEKLKTTQDFDLWFRMMRGTPIACHPDALSLTRVHGQQTGSTSAKSHSTEGDDLWINMMETVSEKEKAELDGSPYNFYRSLYRLLYPFVHRQAVAHAKRKALDELRKSGGAFRHIKAIGLYTSGYTALLRSFFASIKDAGISNTAKRVKMVLKRLFSK